MGQGIANSMVESLPAPRARPLSPHVQVWRWHVTLAASILHRFTGIGLYLGLLILAGWALALASGVEAYSRFTGLLGSIPGKIVLVGITVCLFFHMANGLRHLAWDFGKGFAPATATRTAWAAFAFAVVAAAALWIVLTLKGAI
jgi:succinate dehydrogenase / fumarate reductase cytochrome b subunit